MHGSYGLIWLIKGLAFPDPSWQRKVTIGGAVNAFIGVLGWYWVFGWLLARLFANILEAQRGRSPLRSMSQRSCGSRR
jgi:hypothetical protein